MADIDQLLKVLVQRGGSDLHLSPERQPRIRVDGDILPLELPVRKDGDIRKMLHEIMPERVRRELERTDDLDFAYEHPSYGRLRVNVFRDRFGTGGVFRLIPSEIPSPDQLGLPPAVVALARISRGLVLVTGPTGSGKSTTLAALTEEINRTQSGHIITIEDPIEYVHRENKCLINQREVHSHTESFAGALRAALREDPNVVLVGEMRDLETIEAALMIAETGHLVFATLHTNTAASTIDRIIDSFPAGRQNQVRTMLADTLRAVVAQTLCKRKTKGRVAAMEVLLVNRAVASLIRDAHVHQIPSAMQTGRAQGMMLLNDSLIKLVKDNVVSSAEAYSKSVDRAGMAALFKENGIPVPADAVSD
jgi:twitching motility protein PilT